MWHPWRHKPQKNTFFWRGSQSLTAFIGGKTALRCHVPPCMQQLRRQYERQSKLGCPAETTLKRHRTKMPKTMFKFFWPLLIVNLRNAGLIWRGIAYVVLFKIRQLLPYQATLDELRVSFHAGAWRRKMFHIFHFFTTWNGLGKL